MKINNLKINGFGKLKEKEIHLENGINLIYGKNEAGKSTLLKFIISMFYGVSKNKNGGSVPEIEKYEPWHTEDFSGKINYELDNGKTFEVFRDFRKKNPKILNENLEDISKEFTIDKTKGNLFFEDQTGLEEEIFSSSIITKQAEVKLDEKTQNTLIQKISNILGTGEDTTSYTTIQNKLKKKLADEVGTANTKERPINLVESRLELLAKEKEELEAYQKHQFDIGKEIEEKAEEIQKQKEELEQLRQAHLQKEKLKEEENKIEMNEALVRNFDEDIDILQQEMQGLKKEQKPKKPRIQWVVGIVLLACSALSIIFVQNQIAKWILPAIFVVALVFFVVQKVKEKTATKELQLQKKEREQRIKILEQNKRRQETELKKIQENYQKQLANIQNKYHIQNLDTILEQINEKQKEMNEESITLHTLKVDNNQLLPKLERLVNIEEELEDLQEQKTELEVKRENIKRTIECLEIAYNKMKEQITPKFTEELSKAMVKIADGKYKSVNINTNGELVVEQANGEYVTAENLSIGTIDQLYLALRLATIKEITKENMPIILDEAFAYYDNDRLENILNYLATEYANKQIIIFTCTKREETILERLNVGFQKIEL